MKSRFVQSTQALLISASLALSGGALAADPIKIGWISSLTGALSSAALAENQGVQLAVDEINKRGGVLGRKLSFVMQDSVCRPADSVAAAEKLLSQDKVDVLLGDLCSGATLALMPVVEKAGKPMIVSISTLPEITAKAGVGGNKWVFRTVANDLMLGAVIARQAAGYKTISVLAEDTDYGRTAVKLLKERLGAAATFVSEDYVKPSETDFLPMLTKYRSTKPDAIAVYMLDQQGMNVMKQYLQFGLTMPLIGRPPLVSPLVTDMLASGKFNTSWTVYPYYDQYRSAENDAFAKPFTEKNKQGPHYVAFGIYEGVMIAADAIKRAGSTDANAVREALVKSNYKGILGPIVFDANQQSHNNLMLMTVNNGSLVVKELVSGK